MITLIIMMALTYTKTSIITETNASKLGQGEENGKNDVEEVKLRAS